MSRSGVDPWEDVFLCFSLDPHNMAGDGYQLEGTVEAGQNFELTLPIGPTPQWIHLVEGLARGDDTATTLASFQSPFTSEAVVGRKRSWP